ncbi:MAG: RES domain-containing protein [Oceanicaulis sp.]
MISSQRRLKARLVRAARPYYSHLPASGEGARRHGGRFNRQGAPALYLSFRLETAASEVRFTLNYQPYTFYFLEVDCGPVADLSSAGAREALGVSASDLECPNWESEMYRGIKPRSHLMADRLIERGYAGAVVPSFAAGAGPDDLNLVLWTWEEVTHAEALDGAGSKVCVLNRAALPVDAASWPDRQPPA